MRRYHATCHTKLWLYKVGKDPCFAIYKLVDLNLLDSVMLAGTDGNCVVVDVCIDVHDVLFIVI